MKAPTRTITRVLLTCVFTLSTVAVVGCSGGGNGGGGSGGANGSGGSGSGGTAPGTGGAAPGSGGSASGSGGSSSGSGGSGGVPATGSGGAVSSGGSGSGGAPGGAPGGGGRAASGGASGGGGRAATGGAPGGASGGGGRAASGGSGIGGSGTGGSTGAGGATTSAGCGTTDVLKSGRASIMVGGMSREYILRMPDDYNASKPYKLIFGFHARGGTAAQVAGSSNNDYYGLFARAGGSAVFVSPEGIDAGWRNTDNRDIDLVKAILALVNSKTCIDQRRIFSVGFSFGGMMSDAVGCAMADVFRAIAPMAGAVQTPDHLYSECNQPNMHPIAVWMAHGDSDTVVPLADGKVALDIFVKRAGCNGQTMPVSPSPCVAYQGCMADYPIHFCQWSGGHGVPSFGSQAIWAFFNQF